MSDTEKTEFPDEFVKYARQKLASSRDYIKHRALFGPPLLKEWANMVLAAAGDGVQ